MSKSFHLTRKQISSALQEFGFVEEVPEYPVGGRIFCNDDGVYLYVFTWSNFDYADNSLLHLRLLRGAPNVTYARQQLPFSRSVTVSYTDVPPSQDVRLALRELGIQV